jgi:hypothetical protein
MGVEFAHLEWCMDVVQYVAEGQRCVTFSHPRVGIVCIITDPSPHSPSFAERRREKAPADMDAAIVGCHHWIISRPVHGGHRKRC